MPIKIIFGLLLFALAGCVTPAKQTEALLKERQNLPPVALVEHVPFVNQTADYCGPATLTMALQWAGKPAEQKDIARQVYTPGAKGSLQTDLISASRRQGMMAIPIQGLSPLLKEISAGHPVIVFENLALPWFPQWHYAIVFGYDLNQQTVTMHSGPEQNKHWDMSKFERSWMLGDYWGLVVLPPGQLSATGSELSHVTAAAALEQIGKTEEARVSYLSILERWPQSLAALIGLGNLSFAKADYSSSVQYLHQATQAHPESAVAWHNQAIAEAAAHLKKDAHVSATKALSLASMKEKANYQKDLGQL